MMRFFLLLVITFWVSFLPSLLLAGQKAYYHPNANHLFWFMVLSDTPSAPTAPVLKPHRAVTQGDR
jgi:hypothetical protein